MSERPLTQKASIGFWKSTLKKGREQFCGDAWTHQQTLPGPKSLRAKNLPTVGLTISMIKRRF
jgi:hypothetical protein